MFIALCSRRIGLSNVFFLLHIKSIILRIIVICIIYRHNNIEGIGSDVMCTCACVILGGEFGAQQYSRAAHIVVGSRGLNGG